MPPAAATIFPAYRFSAGLQTLLRQGVRTLPGKPATL
jgi:hypothetical protein